MPEYDWSARLTTGELIACTAAMATATATAGVYTHIPALAPAAIGAAAVAGQVIYSARAHSTRTALTTRAASWLLATGWTTFHVAAHAPPAATGWITAACAAILAAAANVTITRTEPARQHEKALLSFKRQAARTMDEWVTRLERVAKIPGCVVLPTIKPWPEDAGYTLEVELPEGGTTWREIATYTEQLGSDMALPTGCGVEIVPGKNRRRVIIRVSTRDMITETVLYTEDFTPLDMNDGASLGFHRDGTDAVISLLDDCGIFIGDTGSGKTNLLNSVIAALARMPNVLVWVIDTTGAGVALPWITPWALTEDGRTDQACAPVVDWVAHTPAEARIMLRMAVQIIALRKAGYQKLMRAHNTDKIPISPQVPEILVIADETAELDNRTQALIDSGMNTGRAVRVRYLNSALRATQDTITAAMKKRAKVRVGMHTQDPEELAYLFSGYKVLDMEDAPVPGSGFYTYIKGGPRPFKARRMEPDLITRCCVATADRRPALDPVACKANLYAAYEGRWARALPALYPDDTSSFSDAVQAYLNDLAERGVDPDLTPYQDDDPDLLAGDGAGDNVVSMAKLDSMFDAATRAHAPAPSVGGGEDAGENEHFDRVVREAGEPAPPPAPVVRPATLSPETRAYQLLYAAGPDGTGATELSDSLEGENVTAPRTTVQRWLRNWTEQDRAVRTGAGSHVRYIHKTHAGRSAADTPGSGDS